MPHALPVADITQTKICHAYAFFTRTICRLPEEVHGTCYVKLDGATVQYNFYSSIYADCGMSGTSCYL